MLYTFKGHASTSKIISHFLPLPIYIRALSYQESIRVSINNNVSVLQIMAVWRDLEDGGAPTKSEALGNIGIPPIIKFSAYSTPDGRHMYAVVAGGATTCAEIMAAFLIIIIIIIIAVSKLIAQKHL